MMTLTLLFMLVLTVDSKIEFICWIVMNDRSEYRLISVEMPLKQPKWKNTECMIGQGPAASKDMDQNSFHRMEWTFFPKMRDGRTKWRPNPFCFHAKNKQNNSWGKCLEFLGLIRIIILNPFTISDSNYGSEIHKVYSQFFRGPKLLKLLQKASFLPCLENFACVWIQWMGSDPILKCSLLFYTNNIVVLSCFILSATCLQTIRGCALHYSLMQTWSFCGRKDNQSRTDDHCRPESYIFIPSPWNQSTNGSIGLKSHY